MPNWCEGKIKIRGKKEDILNFIKKGIQLTYFERTNEELVVKHIPPEVELSEIFDEIIIKNLKEGYDIYIKDTRRHFLENFNDIYIHNQNSEEQIIYIDFKSAWGIDVFDLEEISKKYNIDFKIYAFEKGMEFNLDIEIVKGKVIKNQEIKFDDYIWECINPSLGG